ncbi:MAG: DUF3857 domain-containing protein [Opitutaceae bacterium]
MQIFIFLAALLSLLSIDISASTKVSTYHDLNCSIELPADWKCSYDLGSRDALAKQIFLKGVRGSEHSSLFINSEAVNPGSVTNRDEVYSGFISEVFARFNARRTIRSGRLSLDGVDGAFRIATTLDEVGDGGYVGAWYGEKNGFLYSLTVLNQQETVSPSDMIRECVTIWNRFRMIDSDRLGFSGNQLCAEPWIAARLLQVDIGGIGWLEVEQMPSEYLRQWVFGNIASLDVGVIPLGGVEWNEDAVLDSLFSFLQVNGQLTKRSQPVATQIGSFPALLIEVEVQNEEMPLIQYLKYAHVDGHLVYAWLACAAYEVDLHYPELVNQTNLAIQSTGTQMPAVAFAIAPELADFYNELGLTVTGRSSPGVAYPLIEQAYKCAPDNPVYLVNLLDIALLVQQEAAAKELVAKSNPELLLDPNVLARLAMIESRAGDRARSIELFKEAIDLRLRDTSYIEVFLDMLSEEGRNDEALEVLEKLRESGQERDLMLIEAGFFIKEAEFEQAAVVLNELETVFYRDANSVMFWAEVYLSTEQIDECIAMCEEYLATDRNSGVMISLARALIEKKEIRSAKTWVEHAMDLSPTDQSLKTYHDYVSGLLGRQGNVVLDFEIQAVPVSEELNMPISSPKTEDEIMAGAHFDLSSKAIQLKNDGAYKTTYRYQLTVHDKSGLREWNEIGIPFEPLYEKLYVNRLSVHDSEGALVFEGTGDMDSLYVIEDTSSGLLTNRKMLRIPLVGLEVGSTAELVVSTESTTSRDELPFKEHYFASRIPVRVSTLSIHSEDGAIATQSFNMDEGTGKIGHQEWRIEYPGEFRNEAHLPDYSDFTAFVVAGPHGASWEALGNQYWDEVSDLFLPDEWTVSVVESIQSDHPNDTKAQMAAAMAYVQDRLRYQGVLFGVRYQIPNTADDILRHSYGDCKDHSLLLIQLLQALEIENSPFLVNTNGIYSEVISTTDQFNHMLVYASIQGVDYFLDATKKSQDPLLPDLDLSGSYGLIVEEKASRITQVPSIVEVVDVSIIRQHVFDPSEKLMSVTEKAAFSRPAADKYRDVIYHISRRDINEWLERMLSFGNVDVDILKSDMGDLSDLSSELEVNLRYDVNDYNASAGGTLRSPLGWERIYLNFRGDSSRNLPFEIESPLKMKTTSQFITSNGVALRKHTIEDSVDTKWCRWDFSVEEIEGAVEMTASITLHPGIYPSSDYAAFRESIGQFIALLESPIQLLSVESE